MRYLELDGRKLSRIGLGCWQFGEPGWGYGDGYGPQDSIDIIRRALELGITVLDTAELYGAGTSEALVGTALREWSGEVFLATKFLPIMPVPRVMVSHCRQSLERLQRPLVDLYQIHIPNPVIPLGVQMEGMRQILAAGLSLYAGVSNFTLSRWRRAERLLGAPIISNQVRYNLLQRRPERDLLGWAQRQHRIVIAYSPLAQGALSGRYSRDNLPSGVRRTNHLFAPAALEAAAPLVSLLGEIGERSGATAAQVALAYLIAQPQVIAIPGANSIAQLEANVAAADLELSAEELLAIRRAADLFQYSKTTAAGQMLGRMTHRSRGVAKSPS
ncbi:MAG: aldo/keto reductase [Candidatus Dormibacteria bacterium]